LRYGALTTGVNLPDKKFSCALYSEFENGFYGIAFVAFTEINGI
jgi:hypothetical protein